LLFSRLFRDHFELEFLRPQAGEERRSARADRIPYGKHDDQADSTSQFLDWFKQASQDPGLIAYARRELA
jgi:hypothetical protein